jgi:hypothetical protein
MARQETVTYSYNCDVCGKDADGSHKITYGNGTRSAVYEIDLCAADGKKLAKAQDALSALLGQGRKTAGGRPTSARTKRSSTRVATRSDHGASGSDDAGAIREWAKASGYEVSDRGRISAGLREAYANAT